MKNKAILSSVLLVSLLTLSHDQANARSFKLRATKQSAELVDADHSVSIKTYKVEGSVIRQLSQARSELNNSLCVHYIIPGRTAIRM